MSLAEELRTPLTRTQRLWIAGVYFKLSATTSLSPVNQANVDSLLDEHGVPTYRDELSHDQVWVLDPPAEGEAA